MKTSLLCSVAISLSLVLQQGAKIAKPQASAPSQAPGTIQIGEIDFFGYGDLDPSKLREALPVRQGQRYSRAEWDAFGPKIEEAMTKLTGHPPTDRAEVCCDSQGANMIYIGLAVSSRPLAHTPPPSGEARLPAEVLKLETDHEDASSIAVQAGKAGEDDSKGYALSTDAATRAIELKMRKFALGHSALIRKVLQSSGDVEHRRAAAEFLGYDRASASQVAALIEAGRDSDWAVRNNAVRALGVLAEAGNKLAVRIPASPFIDLINSGQWTDRNKGGYVLLGLTKSRDPEVLAELHQKSLPALIEMARWQFSGHALTARILLGRIAGIEETKLSKMVGHADQVETIVKAAQVTR